MNEVNREMKPSNQGKEKTTGKARSTNIIMKYEYHNIERIPITQGLDICASVFVLVSDFVLRA